MVETIQTLKLAGANLDPKVWNSRILSWVYLQYI